MIKQENYDRTIATAAYRFRLALRELPEELHPQAYRDICNKVAMMSVGDKNLVVEGPGLVRVVEEEINTATQQGEPEKGNEAV